MMTETTETYTYNNVLTPKQIIMLDLIVAIIESKSYLDLQKVADIAEFIIKNGANND